MSRQPNYLKYPTIMRKPYPMHLHNETITIYEYYFDEILELYNFLKSNPAINIEIFKMELLSSIIKSKDFAGVPYEEAIEKLLDAEDEGFIHYSAINDNIQKFASHREVYKTVKSLAGAPDPIAIATNSPYTSTTRRKVKVAKDITLNVQVAYSYETTKKQVLNRALIITNLINSLEKRNYNVEINAFMLGIYDKEVIKATFEIKKGRQQADYQALYKTLVDVEFLRRLCFRLIEVSDVTEQWQYGYGRNCSKEMCFEILGLNENELFFDQPNAMEIKGKDIGEDFEGAIKKLGLEYSIDVFSEKERLIECESYLMEKTYHK